MSEKSIPADRRTLAIYARFGMTSCPDCGTAFEEGMGLTRLGRGPVRCSACAEKLKQGSQPAPAELRRIYELLDDEILPVLSAAGVHIAQEDLRQMFHVWIDRTTPKPNMVLTGGTAKQSHG